MQAAVDVLRSEGVDTVFGGPRAANLRLDAALAGSGIRHLIVRHEEGATHMADGWARTTGKVGVAIGTSGPAGTNMITGLYTAQADSVPIICLTGQAARAKLHQEAFQAVDIVESARPVTKWAVQVKEAAQIPWVLRRAFRAARSGRPGAVLVDLPIDVQHQESAWDAAERLLVQGALTGDHQPGPGNVASEPDQVPGSARFPALARRRARPSRHSPPLRGRRPRASRASRRRAGPPWSAVPS